MGRAEGKEVMAKAWVMGCSPTLSPGPMNLEWGPLIVGEPGLTPGYLTTGQREQGEPWEMWVSYSSTCPPVHDGLVWVSLPFPTAMRMGWGEAEASKPYFDLEPLSVGSCVGL